MPQLLPAAPTVSLQALTALERHRRGLRAPSMRRALQASSGARAVNTPPQPPQRKHFAFAWQGPAGVVVDVVAESRRVWRATLAGAEGAQLRFQGRYLVIGDNLGRVWAVDVTTGSVRVRTRVLA